MPEIIMDFLMSRIALLTVMGLTVIDTLTGVVVAVNRKELNSSISMIGVSQKVVMLLFICAAILVERHMGGIQIGSLAAAFYIGVEGLSIVENVGRLGVPLPQSVVDALEKIKSDSESSSKKARKHVHLESPSIEVKTDSAVVKGRDTDQHERIED